MKTKILYLLMCDSGDGSHAIHYTFDGELVNKLSEAADRGELDYDDIGMNGGDGFCYDTLNVPEDATYESLGISYAIDDDYADRFGGDDEGDEK